jgi:hypothetical protein
LDEGGRRREQWLDGFVTENDERSHRPQAAGKCFIAARAADAGDDVLAAQLFQVISGLAGTVLCVVLVTDGTHPGGDIGGGEAAGRGRQGDDRLDHRAHAGLVEIDAADDGFADLCSGRELLCRRWRSLKNGVKRGNHFARSATDLPRSGCRRVSGAARVLGTARRRSSIARNHALLAHASRAG